MIKRLFRFFVVIALIGVLLFVGLLYFLRQTGDVTAFLPNGKLKDNITFFAENFDLTADAVLYYEGEFDESLSAVSGVDYCFSVDTLKKTVGTSLLDLSLATDYLTFNGGSLCLFSLSLPMGKGAFSTLEELCGLINDEQYLFGYTATLYLGLRKEKNECRSLLYEEELRYTVAALPFDENTDGAFVNEITNSGMKILSPLAMGISPADLTVLLGLAYDAFPNSVIGRCLKYLDGKWYALALIRGGDPSETLEKHFDGFHALPV